MNILVVDDDILVQKSVNRVLKMNGYEVDIADDGQMAFEKSQEKEYDIVLCDIRMPRMNGIETLDKINGRVKKKLLMTGYYKEMETSTYPLLKKPFGVDELLRHVTQ